MKIQIMKNKKLIIAGFIILITIGMNAQKKPHLDKNAGSNTKTLINANTLNTKCAFTRLRSLALLAFLQCLGRPVVPHLSAFLGSFIRKIRRGANV